MDLRECTNQIPAIPLRKPKTMFQLCFRFKNWWKSVTVSRRFTEPQSAPDSPQDVQDVFPSCEKTVGKLIIIQNSWKLAGRLLGNCGYCGIDSPRCSSYFSTTSWWFWFCCEELRETFIQLDKNRDGTLSSLGCTQCLWVGLSSTAGSSRLSPPVRTEIIWWWISNIAMENHGKPWKTNHLCYPLVN